MSSCIVIDVAHHSKHYPVSMSITADGIVQVPHVSELGLEQGLFTSIRSAIQAFPNIFQKPLTSGVDNPPNQSTEEYFEDPWEEMNLRGMKSLKPSSGEAKREEDDEEGFMMHGSLLTSENKREGDEEEGFMMQAERLDT